MLELSRVQGTYMGEATGKVTVCVRRSQVVWRPLHPLLLSAYRENIRRLLHFVFSARFLLCVLGTSDNGTKY